MNTNPGNPSNKAYMDAKLFHIRAKHVSSTLIELQFKIEDFHDIREPDEETLQAGLELEKGVRDFSRIVNKQLMIVETYLMHIKPEAMHTKEYAALCRMDERLDALALELEKALLGGEVASYPVDLQRRVRAYLSFINSGLKWIAVGLLSEPEITEYCVKKSIKRQQLPSRKELEKQTFFQRVTSEDALDGEGHLALSSQPPQYVIPGS